MPASLSIQGPNPHCTNTWACCVFI
ncbi:unnamed protein product, partial [Adineta steineri]